MLKSELSEVETRVKKQRLVWRYHITYNVHLARLVTERSLEWHKTEPAVIYKYSTFYSNSNITLNQPMWLPNSAYTGSEFRFKHACAELQS